MRSSGPATWARGPPLCALSALSANRSSGVGFWIVTNSETAGREPSGKKRGSRRAQAPSRYTLATCGAKPRDRRGRIAERPRVCVVLTWGNQHGMRERILASGFDLHLSRPITAEEIDRALRDKLRHTA